MTFQNVILAAYAIALCIWSGSIALAGDGQWLAGGVPVAGWFWTLARFDLWGSGFAMMTGFWLMCVVAAIVARVRGRRG